MKKRLLLVGLLTACGESGPEVSVVVTPTEGAAPLLVSFDATGSRDVERPTAQLYARFDFDGDGNFDTEPSTDLAASFVYEVTGTFEPRVEISSVEERVSVGNFSVKVAPNTPPVARLSVTAQPGPAPVVATIDASASTDPDQDAATLEYRFDFDGDGTFDTEFGAVATLEHRFQRAGQFVVTVMVRDRAGATTTATANEKVNVAPGADIDVDTNRDGAISDADDEGEDEWTVDHGAVFLANVDDDDFDFVRDGLNATFEGGNDVADFVQIIVNQTATLSAGDAVSVTVTPQSAADSVRVFGNTGGGLAMLHRPGDAGSFSLDATEVAQAPVTLLMEAIRTRQTNWDGRVTLTLAINTNGTTLTDAVELRVSPVIFPDNTRPAERVFVMRITDQRAGANLPFYDALDSDLANDIELYNADEFEYVWDRWLQDPLQTGYQAIATPNGMRTMKTHLQTERPTGRQGLEPFLTAALLGPDLGYAYPGRSRHSSLNYGGNLEVAPAHEGYPFGRIVIGGGDDGLLDGAPYSDGMSDEQRAWLNAQGLQGPVVEVSTEWLAVGHVDEIFMFTPNLAPDAPRPWIVMLASPALAQRQLQEVLAGGGGSLAVFRGRETETTVATILGNQRLMEYQDAAQARIDSIREVLETSFGLTDEDFVEVPVLFEWHFFDGLELSAAYNPGIQNLVIANGELFVPDPEGPPFEGTDIWRVSAERTISALGLTPKFVDVFESYHLALGEAHCGTEVERTPFEMPWWLHDGRP